MKASYLKVSASSERKKCFCKILEDLGFMPWGHMLSNTFLGQAAKFCQRKASTGFVLQYLENLEL
jgi:hypothetical protein